MDDRQKKKTLAIAAGVIGLLAIILIARSLFSGGPAPESAEYERIKREGGSTPPPPTSDVGEDSDAGAGRRPASPTGG